ncbi:RluA family pseudouridine synthase [Tenuibacillus multivorans]|uniref:Pseudouridine synthase n=1 Tax=Tenuibacillus multivorans TaxID=237069 RepID=A0A1G9Y4I9_9BACI|nr:RluA family pseudouridine synthase [Tenuibacillus multivorans]GEL75949.1 pseudouridine synthase [Tenuibacillus multivorans]SDN04052.1 23S rRNA pseudouridine1911/1915/1917 synthase [Tenuibacillus multivorans]
MSKHQYVVTETYDNKRIDKVLTDLNKDASRSQIQSWIKDGLVLVNGQNIKSNYKCQLHDDIQWEESEVQEMSIEPENIPLDIVYEDEHLLVVNKEKGMVVHPSHGHRTGTLVHALLYHCDDLSGINGVYRPGIVHRIDKDTSGLLVVAKHDKVHEQLSDQLANKAIKRQYEAIVHGVINHDKATIDAPIGRDPNDRQKMTVVHHGKPAITHFSVKESFGHYSHVYCDLETGRTHQIRVHFQYIDHPLVGDPKYGRRKTLNVQGQALHARKIEFTHPVTNEQLSFTADPPQVFQDTLEKIAKIY